MSSRQIAFVTFQGAKELDSEDQILARAFEANQDRVEAVCWDDASVDWQKFDAIVVRETWDYWQRYAEFLAWLTRMEKERVPMMNPPAFLKANTDKRYLRGLEKSGVMIAPTEWVEKGSHTELARVLEKRGWDDAVLKPTVSGNGYLTFRVDLETAPRHQGKLEQILESGSAMIQAFVPEILIFGELSLIFFGGEFSHAVRKKASGGDFRVQSIYGGQVFPESVSEAALNQAKKILSTIDENLLYVRLDMVESRQGLILMEFEAAEPSLYFSHCSEAARNFLAAFDRIFPTFTR